MAVCGIHGPRYDLRLDFFFENVEELCFRLVFVLRSVSLDAARPTERSCPRSRPRVVFSRLNDTRVLVIRSRMRKYFRSQNTQALLEARFPLACQNPTNRTVLVKSLIPSLIFCSVIASQSCRQRRFRVRQRNCRRDQD